MFKWLQTGNGKGEYNTYPRYTVYPQYILFKYFYFVFIRYLLDIKCIFPDMDHSLQTGRIADGTEKAEIKN